MLLSLLVLSEPARACAPAPPPGETVRIAGEEALIVWDPATRTEHFVRRADFSTAARDFGFLVPTPSAPVLTEAPEGIFDTLAERLEPEVVDENEYSVVTCLTAPFMFLLSRGAEAPMGLQAAPLVTVLSSQRVAGMDATVLQADDADALGGWLEEHGYPMRPALVEWLRPYVDAHFAVTAFRYASDEPDVPVGSRAVRMTFQTDRPFYPYREPTDQPEQYGRLLRVHLVAPGRMRGKLDAAPWGAGVEYARPLTDAAAVLTGIASPPEGAWLTTFLDPAARRAPAHDLSFERAPEQTEHVPRVVHYHDVVIPFPIELVVLAAGVVIFVRRRRRAKKA